MRVADWLMNALVEEGFRHVFMVPGGHSMYLNEAADAHPGLEVVSVLHEQAAAIACEAYYRSSNQMALCMVTAGPGVMNALSGVAAAWLDAIPMFVVSGQIKRDDLGKTVRPRFSPELPTASIVKPFTCYSTIIRWRWQTRYKVKRALRLSHKRRGPVWLDIPLDVQAAEL